MSAWEELRREIEALKEVHNAYSTDWVSRRAVLAIVDRLAAARKEPAIDVERLRAIVREYLDADAAMPEFADAQRMPSEEWDRLNRRWAAADVALRTALGSE